MMMMIMIIIIIILEGIFGPKNLSNGLKVRFFKFYGEGKRDIF